MRKKLVSLGYSVNAALFNTADFGPPQSRNRAWVIAGLKSYDTEMAILDAARFRCSSFPLMEIINQDLVSKNPKKQAVKKHKFNKDAK